MSLEVLLYLAFSPSTNLDFFSYYFLVKPNAQAVFLAPGLDEKMKFLHQLLVEGKFYSIFSFLFGWGISLQLIRAASKGPGAIALVRRRLLGMLCIGLIHLLVWSGDIIFFYAWLGFILLWIRKLQDKNLLRLGIALLLSPILLYGLKLCWPVLAFPSEALAHLGRWIDEKLLAIQSEEAYYALMHTDDFWLVVKSNISGIFYRYSDLIFISRISKVLGMMVLGMWVGSTNFYKNITSNRRVLWMIIAFGLCIGLPANYILSYYLQQKAIYYTWKVEGLYQTIAYAFGVAPLALAYIAALMLAFQHTTFNRITSMVAPVGRMALSNYLTHTIVGVFVFLHVGLGLMEKVGPFYYTIFAVLVFMAQIIFSTIWLNYFNYGPVEWLWRSFTYRKWQKMVK